jgi:acetyl esterase/lipase
MAAGMTDGGVTTMPSRARIGLIAIVRTVLLGVAVVPLMAGAGAGERLVVPLWPGGPPGKQSSGTQLKVEERGVAGGPRDRAATGITQPALTVFEAAKPNGSALLIIPGGAYARVVMDKEGYETARWFAEHGTTAFVLLYRLPGESWADGPNVVLQDTQRSMRIVRSQAERFSLDTRRIGVMGFSAGGHAAAILSTRFADVAYSPSDVIDAQSARPDFTVLMYPVISMDEDVSHAASRMNLLGGYPESGAVEAQSPQRHVSAATPPTFLLHAADDQSVVVENSLLMHSALRKANVATELHVFAVGGHGFGMRQVAGLPVATWPELVRAWMLQLFDK